MKDNLSHTIKKSVCKAGLLLGGVNTVVGVWGYTIKDIDQNMQWWKCALILASAFIVLAFIIFVFLYCCKPGKYKLTIRKMEVIVKQGDIFSEPGLKVIPFNDQYDTELDKHNISENTLHGKMLMKHKNVMSYMNGLREAIQNAVNENSDLQPDITKEGITYPLGRIIKYDKYLLLAFSHFDNNNQAYLDAGEYEQALFRMWAEIRRVYQGNPVVIPLLGTGITTIKGRSEKNYTDMLRCILCTLKQSEIHLSQKITIIITKEAMSKTDMNSIKEYF